MRCRNCGWDNQEGNTKCEKCNAPIIGTSNNAASENRSTQMTAARPVLREETSQKTSLHNSSVEDVRKTRREGEIEIESPSAKDTADLHNDTTSSTLCPECEYPITGFMNSCPMCGSNLKTAQPNVMAQTVRKDTTTRKCTKCANLIPSNVRFCPECGSPVRQQTINPWAKSQQQQQQQPTCTLTPIPWEDEQLEQTPLKYSGDTIILNRDNTEVDNPSITSLEQAELINEDSKWYILDKSMQQTTFIYAGKKIQIETGDIVVLGNRRFEFKE